MSESIVLNVLPLGFPWPTVDPFLFCVHHLDLYPPSNEAIGPAASLTGREIGMDFAGKDGWRMYHGDVVPGFPRHPHRGFETVTLARHGFIDHSDSLGATARFGQGDVQWMTAGRGIVHSEMFPLREKHSGNRAELFQIWLNLPRASKMVDPHFTMLWSPSIPEHVIADASGRVAGIGTLEQANQFLRERYIAELNWKFAVSAAAKGTAFRRCWRTDLDWIFTVQTERVVAKDNTVTIGDRCWQLEKTRFRHTLAGCTVTIHEHLDGTVSMRYGPHVVGRFFADGATLRAQVTKNTRGRGKVEISPTTRDSHFPTAPTTTPSKKAA